MKITLDKIKNKYSPIAVNFENGKIRDGQELNLKPHVYQKQDKKIVAIPTEKILYTGNVEFDHGLRNYFLIHNKDTNTARLVPLSRANVKPYQRKSKANVQISEKLTSADLNKQFGSKRSKRIIEERERQKTDFNSIKNELEETVAGMQTDDYFLNKLEVTNTDSVLKPPINREASKKEDVYDLNSLVPLDILKDLKLEVETVLASQDLRQFGFKEFVKAHFKKLMAEEYSELVELKCQILLYIDYLIKYLNTPVKNIKKNYVLCKSAANITSHILSNFSMLTGGSRMRPTSMRDKGVCYILVLALFVTDYEYDLTPLSLDLKIGLKKLQEMSRVVALSNIKSTYVMLKFPLPAVVVHSESRPGRR